MTKCPNCKIRMKTCKTPVNFKLNPPTIIVEEIKYEFCPKCGLECVDEKEYERVRKIVNSVASLRKAKLIVI